jgi:8-oxo-dGTP pyrophosphatase MutT (NUDIX family)
MLASLPQSALSGFFTRRGYRSNGPSIDGWSPLQPPHARDDLEHAASICLLHLPSDQLLLGERLTTSWQGYWSFPGGRIEPGEHPFAAARRELAEETGIELAELYPTAAVEIMVADERRCFSITNYLVLTLEQVAPQRSTELAAQWLPRHEALARRPMAAGTRRALDLHRLCEGTPRHHQP